MENYEVAFGNEVARMISLCSIIESNSYLRFPSPQSKQTSLGLLWRPHFFANRHSLGLLLGTRWGLVIGNW